MKVRRLPWLVALSLLGGASAAGLLWWRQGSEPVPSPLLPDLAGANDPVLAGLVDKMRQRVLRQPRAADAWGDLGKVLLANGYLDEAVPCFEQAARLAPGEARWPYFQGLIHRQNDLDAALACFRQAARVTSPSDPTYPKIRLRFAEFLMNAGNTEEAGPVLGELLRQEPDNPRIHLALGALAADGNDVETALDHLLRCADHPLTRQRAATHLSRVYLRKGDPAAAERYRKRAGRLPPDPEGDDPFLEEYAAFTVGRRALFLRAENFLRAGEVPKAIAILRPLVAEHPDEVEAHVKLGMAWAKIGNYSEAEAVLRRGMEADPENVQAHFFLGLALFHRAEQSGERAGFEAAAAEVREALARRPLHAYAHLYLGLALRKLGQEGPALEELREAVRLSPESTDPHLHLGEALLAAGRKEEGLAQLERAADLAGDEDRRPQEALKKWRKPPTEERPK